MPYPSVDAVQKALGETLFSNRTDIKKAAGRALGTIVELITFYMIKQWGYLPHLTIERGLAEFGNDAITHNVEFGIHHCFEKRLISITDADFNLPLSAKKIRKIFGIQEKSLQKSNVLFCRKEILRNACVIEENASELYVAHMESFTPKAVDLSLSRLKSHPFAMIECKRVGVEEGMKKGPTTIEKAKQGAYVAKHVSSLQKVRGFDGTMYGVRPLKAGGVEIRDLQIERNRLIYEVPANELEGFILTIGIVSNHGNWFTAENMNKELLVLKDSYDWLLFLTDAAIAEFVSDTILSNDPAMSAVKDAFARSYSSGESGKNEFTKVRINYKADQVLNAYFTAHQLRIENTWFNILSPTGSVISGLKAELDALSKKV